MSNLIGKGEKNRVKEGVVGLQDVEKEEEGKRDREPNFN